MRLLQSLILASTPLAVYAAAASGWNFDEAIISVTSKGSGVGGGFRDKYVEAIGYFWLISWFRWSVQAHFGD